MFLLLLLYTIIIYLFICFFPDVYSILNPRFFILVSDFWSPLHVCLAGMCFYNFSFISLSKIILSYFNFTYYRGFSDVRIH